MKKRLPRLHNMNLFDKAALGALCVLIGAGIAITTYENHRPLQEGGHMTVSFPLTTDSFGADIVLGEVVYDHNQVAIGSVLDVQRDAEACRISIATVPEYDGAVGQTVFLRSKHFSGVGEIKSYLIGEVSHALG